MNLSRRCLPENSLPTLDFQEYFLLGITQQEDVTAMHGSSTAQHHSFMVNGYGASCRILVHSIIFQSQYSLLMLGMNGQKETI